MRRVIVSMVSGLVLLMAGIPSASNAAEYVPGEVIVAFDERVPRKAAVESIPGVESIEAVGAMTDTRLLDLAPGESVVEAISELEARPDVAYAQPNWILHIQALPNDPMFGQLWGLRNAGQNVSEFNGVNVFGFKAIDSGAWRAWNFRTGGRQAVGVIDTGISRQHPDLRRNIDFKLSRNFAPLYPGGTVNPKNWDDPHGHGTHVAGTIGAVGNNGLGVAGVNWRTRLVALRVCSADADCTSDAMAAALDYAGRKGIRVVNMSIGSDPDGPFSENRVVIEAIRRHPGTLLVNSAGNESNNNDQHKEWPCSSTVKNLLCVAAIDPRGKLAYFSNWGRKTVDLAAPGQYITSTWANKVYPLDDVFFRDGTANWVSDGWQEVIVEDLPELQFNGLAAESWVGPARSFDLAEMRFCRINASLGGHLTGLQKVVAQYRRDGGPWTNATGSVEVGELKDEEEAFFFYAGGAGGSGQVEIRLLYESGGAPGPAPLIRLSAADITCIAKMPPGGTYRQLEGTSMASPHVAGVAALVRAAYPKLRGVRLKRVLMSTAVNMNSLKNKTVTGGRVDAFRAIRKARMLKNPRR